MKKIIIVLFGPQGVGKGTVGEKLADKYKIPLLGTGNLFREEIKKQTKLGKLAARYINQGKYVPNEVTIKMLQETVKGKEYKNGFFLDGFPRSVEQAIALEKITKVDAVLNLTAPKTMLIERLSNRMICSVCQTIYNIKTKHPKKQGICDACGGKLYRREDETPEFIESRLKEYDTKTKPVLDYYRKKKLVYEIDASRSLDKIKDTIKDCEKAITQAVQ